MAGIFAATCTTHPHVVDSGTLLPLAVKKSCAHVCLPPGPCLHTLATNSAIAVCFASFLCWTDLRPTRRLHDCILLCIISLLDGVATNSAIAVCFDSFLCRTGLRPNQRLQFAFHHASWLLGKHVGFDLLSEPNPRSKAHLLVRRVAGIFAATCLCEAGGRHLCSHLLCRAEQCGRFLSCCSCCRS